MVSVLIDRNDREMKHGPTPCNDRFAHILPLRNMPIRLVPAASGHKKALVSEGFMPS